MSRTISPCSGIPASGSFITVPFPDLAKPEPGGWTVDVSLRSTTSPPRDSLIVVKQGGRTVASKKITPTSSFADYSLSVSDADLDNTTTGLCHEAGPVVIIAEGVITSCCPANPLPVVLSISLSCPHCADPPNFGCACWGGASFPITYDLDLDAWTGSGNVAGCNTELQITLKCRGGVWFLTMFDCETTWWGDITGLTCDPFQIVSGDGITGGLGISTLCCGTLIGSAYPVKAVITE